MATLGQCPSFDEPQLAGPLAVVALLEPALREPELGALVRDLDGRLDRWPPAH
jgi:hypothetical protein